jgi:hypothetical protein
MAVKETVDSSDKIFDLSNGSGIVVDDSTSTITVSISSEDTSDAPAGVWVYDLEVSVDGKITKLLTGNFEITESVI